MRKPELKLPPRRYEHELLTDRLTSVSLWPVDDSWAAALETRRPKAIESVKVTDGYGKTLAEVVERMRGQGYEFDRILRRKRLVMHPCAENDSHRAVARWRNRAAEKASAARNVFHAGLLEIGGAAYELRRGVDGVMRLPINYALTIDNEVFHPDRPAFAAPEAPIAGEDLDENEAAPAERWKDVEKHNTRAWSENEFNELQSRLHSHGWVFECGLPLNDRDGWHSGPLGASGL